MWCLPNNYLEFSFNFKNYLRYFNFMLNIFPCHDMRFINIDVFVLIT